MSRRGYRRQEMFALVEAYFTGSQSERSFCAEHGLNRSVFAYWRSKYRKENGPGSGFVEIRPPLVSSPSAEIEYPHGIRLRLFGPLDVGVIRRLLASDLHAV